jgi:hypothetical protein
MKKVDMSEKAILKRFNQTEQLREVSLFLMQAKKLHDEKLGKIDKKQSEANETPKP